MKTDRVELLSITAIMTIYFGFGKSTLVVFPTDTVAVVGRLAYFNCSTSDIQSQNIHWKYHDDHVYAGEKFLAPYDERFRIEVDNSTGSCNLVIPNVTKEDAGKYRCFDDKGFGKESGAELIVLDAEPLCTSDMKTDGIVGPNSCNVDPEDIRLSCSVTYKGNIAPMLKWTRIGGSGPINTGVPTCKNSTNRVNCNLTVKADLHLDGSAYVCHTDTTMNINCTSDSIKIIYSFSDFRISERSINDELRCKSNSSQSCSNRWIWNAFDGTSAIFSDQSTVTANRSGIYQCQSECDIRGKQCAVSATFVYIPSDNKTATLIPEPPPSGESKSSEDSNKTTVIIVLATVIVLLLACISILLFCYLKRRTQKSKSQQKVLEQQLLLNPISKEPEEISRLKNELSNEQASHEADRQEIERLKNELLISKDKNKKLDKLDKHTFDRENEWLIKEAEHNQQKADLEERLKSEMNALKTQLESEKIKLEEKINRLVERKFELGHSIYLPPKEPSDYKVEHHQTILTQAVENDEKLGVCGVAVLDNELFVITDAHPEVEVYDLSTFEHRRNIKIYSVVDPGDIVACHKNRRIYVVDWTERNLENKLLRIDSNGKEDRQRLSLADDECRLFLTKDANILVTFYRSRNIIEYTSDWKVVFEVKIKNTDIQPIHAVKLSNGHLAICHGKAIDLTHRVCIVDDDGSLLKWFGGLKGAGVGHVNFPTYLAVNKNDGILVTDRNNGRILLLNSRLEFEAELLSTENKIRLPRTLLLDETKSRLFVADCDVEFYNGHVLIFNLK